MDTKTIIWIAVAVVALLVLGIVLLGGRRRELTHRHAQAEELREQLRHEDAEVRNRESIADVTEARARAAQAEAEAKAAEAARLQNAAQGHRSDVESTREQLEQRRAHADSLDGGGSARSAQKSGPRTQPDG